MTSINGSDNFSTACMGVPMPPCTSNEYYSNDPNTAYKWLLNSPAHRHIACAMKTSGIFNYYDNPNTIFTLFVPENIYDVSGVWVNFIDLIQSLTVKRLMYMKDLVGKKQTAIPTALKGSSILLEFPHLTNKGISITGKSIWCNNGIIHLCN